MEYCTTSLGNVVNETAVKVLPYNVTRIAVTNSVEQRQAFMGFPLLIVINMHNWSKNYSSVKAKLFQPYRIYRPLH